MLSGSFCFELRLNARAGGVNIFGQTSDAFPVVRFVLDAVEPGEHVSHGSRIANTRSKPGDTIEPNRRRVFAEMAKNDFHAVGKAGESDFQLGMSRAQVLENFRASSDDGGLQPSGGGALEARSVGKIAAHASGGGRKPGVGIQQQSECLGFSGHGCWPERRRTLPGNQDNSKDHRSKGER